MNILDIGLAFPRYTNVFCYDTSYAKVSSDWLFNTFAPWFIEDRRLRSLGTWSRKNDCDNAARSFCVFAQDAHANTTQTDDAVAIGEFLYIGTENVKGIHAIVCAFTEEGMVFLEPQDGLRIALTPGEIQSAFRVTF